MLVFGTHLGQIILLSVQKLRKTFRKNKFLVFGLILKVYPLYQGLVRRPFSHFFDLLKISHFGSHIANSETPKLINQLHRLVELSFLNNISE